VFDTLIAHLSKKAVPSWPSNLESSITPLFVSYHTLDHKLRGCIGTFEEKETSDLLPKYSIIAATKDTRFNPIRIDEVQGLIVEISFLTNFEHGYKSHEWEVGKHGITIEFRIGTKSFGSTYLPHVPPLFKSKDECLKSLIEKAGYSGTNWRDIFNAISLTRYQSSIIEMPYHEYVQIE